MSEAASIDRTDQERDNDDLSSLSVDVQFTHSSSEALQPEDVMKELREKFDGAMTDLESNVVKIMNEFRVDIGMELDRLDCLLKDGIDIVKSFDCDKVWISECANNLVQLVDNLRYVEA